MSQVQIQQSRHTRGPITTALLLGVLSVALGLVLGESTAHAYKDQGVTSATHRKNVGRIRFSTQPIAFKRERPSAFRSKFGATNRIYGRLYMRRSLANHPHFTPEGHRYKGNIAGQWGVRVYVNGKEHRYNFGWFHRASIALKPRTRFTTFQVNLNAPGTVHADRKMRTSWARTIAKLTPGRHKIRVEVWSMVGAFKTKKPVATGSFVLVKRKGQSIAAGKLPKAALRSASIRKAMRRALRHRRIAKRSGDIRKVVISSRWQHGRYRGTTRRYRKINGTVVWRSKKKGAICRFVTYKFVSDRRGARWTPLRFSAFCLGCPEGYTRCR